MGRMGWVGIIVVALILFDCNPAEPLRGGVNVDVVLLAEGSESFSLASGRVRGDSVIFTSALIGVTEVELERLDSADMEHHDGDGCANDDHNGPGPGDGDDDDDGDSTGTGGEDGRIAHDGFSNYDDEDEDSTDLHVEGEFIVDLIAGTSTPDLGFSSITPGMFQEIEIGLGRLLPNDNSVFLAFEVVKDTGNVKVEFSSQAEIELEIEKRNGFEVAANPLDQILVLLHLDTLFGWIDYSRAEADEDGVIRINEESNRELYFLIKGRLHNSFEVRNHHEWGD